MPQYAPMVIKGRGGALPQYQGGNSVYAPGQGVSARVDDSSVGIRLRGSEAAGQGMDKLARAIDTAGRTAGAIADQYGRLKGLQAFRGYMQDMDEALYNKDTGLLTSTHGENAFDVERRIRDKQQELHKKWIGDGAGSIFGIDMYFNQDAYEYDRRTYQQGMQHSAGEYNKWVPAQHNAMADLCLQRAVGWAGVNPRESADWLDAAKMHVAMGMRFQGAGPAEIAQRFERIDHDVVNATVGSLIRQGDLDQAEALVTRGGGWTPDTSVPFKGGTLGGGFSQGVQSLAHRWRNVKYDNMDGTRDAEGHGRTDCSGLVVNTADMLSSSGMLGPKALGAIRKGATADGIVNELAKLQGGRTLGNAELTPDRVQPGLAIGMNTTSRRGGPHYGADHIVMTFEGQDGRMMVFESSSGEGVHTTPYDVWYKKWGGKARLYGASMLADSPGVEPGGAAEGGAAAPAGSGAPASGGGSGPYGDAPMPGSWGRGNPCMTPNEQSVAMSKIQAARRGRQAEEAKRAEEAEKARQAQERLEVANTVQEWVQSTTDMESPDERAQYLSAWLAYLPAEQQEFAAKTADTLLKAEEAKKKRESNIRVQGAVRDILSGNMTPPEADKYFERRRLDDDGGLSYAEAEYAKDAAFGQVQETAYTRDAVRTLKTAIDKGQITSVQELEQQALSNRLSLSEIHDVEKYLETGGKAAGLTVSQCESLWRSVTGKSGKLPDGVYETALSLLPDGRTATDAEKRNAVCTALMTGRVYRTDPKTGIRSADFSAMPMYEAMRNAKDWEGWLPELVGDEEEQIRAIFAQGWGVPKTDPDKVPLLRLRLYKRDHPEMFMATKVE